VGGISTLSELTADVLVRYLSHLREQGRSTRTANFARAIVVAFGTWCVHTQRIATNPFKAVPTADESQDRRRVRRPLTDDELARLLSVARKHGREAWYLAAALAGLRRGDLCELKWGDVNFAEATLTIRLGKSRRVDTLPMHQQLAESLQRRLKEFTAIPSARVWGEPVGNLTRLKDFVRAGIARRVPVLDAEGKPVMVGHGVNAKPKMRIISEDDERRVIDLHALRTTLGTQLARAGVAPQVAQMLMRQSDYRTTLRHYTVLGLHDTAAAMARLPSVGITDAAAQAATGTTDSAPSNPQLFCQLLGRETARNRAAGRDASQSSMRGGGNTKTLQTKAISRDSQPQTEVERKRLELSTPSLQS
jgi:integrase